MLQEKINMFAKREECDSGENVENLGRLEKIVIYFYVHVRYLFLNMHTYNIRKTHPKIVQVFVEIITFVHFL